MTSGQVRATNPWRRTAWRTGVPKISKRPRDFLCAPGRFGVFFFSGLLVMPNRPTQQRCYLKSDLSMSSLILSTLLVPNGTFWLEGTSSQIFAICTEAIGSQLVRLKTPTLGPTSCIKLHQVPPFWMVQISVPWYVHICYLLYGSKHCLRRYLSPSHHTPVILPKKLFGSIGVVYSDPFWHFV